MNFTSNQRGSEWLDAFGAAPMESSLAARYQPGGDIYKSVAAAYGAGAANHVASVAFSGDRADVTDALTTIRNGPNTGSTSLVGNFINQITHDPLQAPIAAALGQGSGGPGLGTGTTGKVVKGVTTIGIILLVLYGINTVSRMKGK